MALFIKNKTKQNSNFRKGLDPYFHSQSERYKSENSAQGCYTAAQKDFSCMWFKFIIRFNLIQTCWGYMLYLLSHSA